MLCEAAASASGLFIGGWGGCVGSDLRASRSLFPSPADVVCQTALSHRFNRVLIVFLQGVKETFCHKYCTNQRSICVQNERVHSTSSFFTY